MDKSSWYVNRESNSKNEMCLFDNSENIDQVLICPHSAAKRATRRNYAWFEG